MARCVRAHTRLGSRLPRCFPALAVAAEHKLGPDPAAKCKSIAGSGADQRRYRRDHRRQAVRRRRARADAGRTHHAGDAVVLPGARPHRAGRSEGAADPLPGEPAARLERPHRAVWRRRLQRRADHRRSACRPARRSTAPSPLAQGYVTYGTDSGHETKPGEPPQLFAANDEAFVNFAHASYKKVRDVAVDADRARLRRAARETLLRRLVRRRARRR